MFQLLTCQSQLKLLSAPLAAYVLRYLYFKQYGPRSVDRSGSVGSVRLRIKGLLGQNSLPAESQFCVLEQDTLSAA